MRIRLFRNAVREVVYTNSTPMPETVHGHEVGSTFEKQSMKQMWDGLLYPYQYPSFLTFALSGFSSPRECGDSILAGGRTFTWTTGNQFNIVGNSIKIEDLSTATILGQGIANDGSETVNFPVNVVETVNGTVHRWGITGTNTKSKTFTKEYPITFYSPIYYGVGAAGLDVAGIQQLTKRIAAEGNFNALVSTSLSKVYIAYPAAYGDLVSIEDQNHFNVTGDFIKTTRSFTNNGTYYKGVTMDYIVYEHKNNTTLPNYRFYFNFT